MVIHGSEDPLVRPRAGKATAEAIKGARFELIPGMGHDLVDGVWPILVDHLSELVESAGFPLKARQRAELAG